MESLPGGSPNYFSPQLAPTLAPQSDEQVFCLFSSGNLPLYMVSSGNLPLRFMGLINASSVNQSHKPQLLACVGGEGMGNMKDGRGVREEEGSLQYFTWSSRVTHKGHESGPQLLRSFQFSKPPGAGAPVAESFFTEAS